MYHGFHLNTWCNYWSCAWH